MTMPVKIPRTAIVTLTPAALILLGALVGWIFPLLALLWLTLLAAAMDHVLPEPEEDMSDLWAERLSLGLGIFHILLIPITIAGLQNAWLGPGEQLALFLAVASFMGQVSHPNAHNLIHSDDMRMRFLGKAVYTSMLYGHHVSAHRLVHHVHVGTPNDPATPEHSEFYWAYIARAWIGNFVAGFEAEAEHLEKRGKEVWSESNPYAYWVGGGVLMLLFVVLTGGFWGTLIFLELCLFFHLQILMSDFIQHYGLQRMKRADGSYEPIGPHHSWNAPNGFSAYLMMNAPRHSEHHMNAGRPFQELGKETGPNLPFSMPVMAMIALIPALWFQVMDKRAAKVMEAARKDAEERQPQRTSPEEPFALRQALMN